MNHDWLRVGGFPVKMLPRNESEQTRRNEYFITQARESGVEKQELSCKTCHINCRSAQKIDADELKIRTEMHARTHKCATIDVV